MDDSLEDYRELLENFVEEEYVEMLDDGGLEIAAEYSRQGGMPRTCVGLGLYQCSWEWNLERVCEELEVDRKTLYDARKKLDLYIRPRSDR